MDFNTLKTDFKKLLSSIYNHTNYTALRLTLAGELLFNKTVYPPVEDRLNAFENSVEEPNNMDIGTKVIDIIAEQAILDPGDVTLESTLESLGIDSMGLVESIFAIEEAFDIQIPFNANEPSDSDFNISSVASIISGIEKLVAEKT